MSTYYCHKCKCFFTEDDEDFPHECPECGSRHVEDIEEDCYRGWDDNK